MEIKRIKFKKKKKLKEDVIVYNNGQYEKEFIPAEKGMRLIYGNPVCGPPMLFLVKRKLVSRLYGRYCRSKSSARAIPKFIEKYQVDMTGCESNYKNFADFFAREKNNLRFPNCQKTLGSPCEGLVSINTDIEPENLIAAKDSAFSLPELFGDEKLAEEYGGGTMVRLRLTPTNYHRMHFFDDGVVSAPKFIKGHLYSVNPLAVGRIARLYCRNKRAVFKVSTENFGDVILVEVGATFVGSIVHCFEAGETVNRGQQASYFLPGGSLVLMFFKKNKFNPCNKILAQTAKGFESKISAGEPIGMSL
ncbi:MAG: phosphatidylserine decarboxylase [Oscillospiraceae bacterium]|jgi:phosphatidylserine decarboxylase|nr:phosphatidylserine decarboxylase [Oscillospiraceae bacterium]